MSFGMVSASYLAVMGPSGLHQQNAGIWSGASMAVSLPSTTTPSSVIVLIIAGNTIVSTPAGWTLRESQVNHMGHYLFTRTGGSNSWTIPTNNGDGTWYIAEVGNGTYSASGSANDPGGDAVYVTPVLTPMAGNCLLFASIASVTDLSSIRTVSGWTNGFSEVIDICNPIGDYPMQGVAIRTATTDGVSGYSTTANYSAVNQGRSAIISSFVL